MRVQHLAESSIEALLHAVGSWRPGLGQPVVYAQCLAQLVELVLTRGLAAAASKQPVRELFTVVREDGANLETPAPLPANHPVATAIQCADRSPALLAPH